MIILNLRDSYVCIQRYYLQILALLVDSNLTVHYLLMYVEEGQRLIHISETQSLPCSRPSAATGGRAFPVNNL